MKHSHVEKHFTAPEVLRDIVIGMSDGLTVPFALAAGLTSALSANGIVVTAGLAEIAAGSVAMGLGGYLAAQSDIEHYRSEFKREWNEVREKPSVEEAEVEEIFTEYGLSSAEIQPIVAALKRQPDRWVNFMMRFELGLDQPDPKRALSSALTISAAYIAGGFIPLFPYMILDNPPGALKISVAVTLTSLALFGYVKGRFTGMKAVRSAVQTTVVGALAGAVAFALAGLFHRA